MKYFLGGAASGAALTLAVPRHLPLFQRQLPFLALGLGGIAADYYAIQKKCLLEP